MADIRILTEAPVVLAVSERTLSGTIEVDGSPVVRRVLIYKNGETDISSSAHDLYSEANGTFSATVIAGDNDRFRVVYVGQEGEYSKIYENVVAG